MVLNAPDLIKMEFDLPFKLTPEQKSILLLWFGSDSKFGWSKLDFMLGVHRVRHLYPDHRANMCIGDDGLPYDPDVDFFFVCDNYGYPATHLYDDDADIPF